MLKKILLLTASWLLINVSAVVILCPGFSAEAGNQAFPEQNTLQEIDFWVDQDNALHVQLQGQGPFSYTVTDRKQDRMHILLPESRAAEKLVRLYRLDEMDTPLKSLLLRNTDEGALLTWVWSREPGVQVKTSPEEMIFRLTADQSNAPDESFRELLSPYHAEDRVYNLQGAAPGSDQKYSGEPITIDLQNAEVEHVLRLITHPTDYNLVIDEDVQGRISLRLRDVPWDQALDIVLEQKDLGKELIDNIIRITTGEKLQAQRQRALEERESLRALEPVLQEYFQINYAKASELKPRVEEFLSEEQGRADYDPRTNQLIVRDTASQLEKIRQLINNLDRPERQVLIEARVVYATETFRRELGIRWGVQYEYSFDRVWETGVNLETMNFPNRMDNLMSVGGGLEGLDRVAGSLFVLDAELRLGEAQGQSSTISSPQVMTLNNNEATISQGVQIPYITLDEAGNPTTEFIGAELKLEVTPQITPDNNLILTLEVRDDSPMLEGDEIETREAHTTLLVNDGETIVIGGIKKIDEEALHHRVPGLSNIPLFGRLFQQDFQRERKDELLIFIRPKIQ